MVAQPHRKADFRNAVTGYRRRMFRIRWDKLGVLSNAEKLGIKELWSHLNGWIGRVCGCRTPEAAAAT